jgi:hypothetical protein
MSKQTTVSASDCRYYVQNKLPIKNHSSSLTGNYYFSKRQYVVWSYDHWSLYIYDDQAQHWFGNKTKYSRTTSKHSTQANPLVDNITYLSAERMKYLYANGYKNLTIARLGADCRWPVNEEVARW